MAVIKSFRVLKISTKKCSVSIFTTFAENSVRFMFTKTFLIKKIRYVKFDDPNQGQRFHCVENSRLICSAIQWTVFCKMSKQSCVKYIL